MKLIKAYVRDYMVHQVVDALKAENIQNIFISYSKMSGTEIGEEHVEISSEYGSYVQMVKIEFYCSNHKVEKLRDIILEKGKTGYKGDGVVYVIPLDNRVSL